MQFACEGTLQDSLADLVVHDEQFANRLSALEADAEALITSDAPHKAASRGWYSELFENPVRRLVGLHAGLTVDTNQALGEYACDGGC